MISWQAFASRVPLRKPWPDGRWEPIGAMTALDAQTDTAIEARRARRGTTSSWQRVRLGRFRSRSGRRSLSLCFVHELTVAGIALGLLLVLPR